MFFTKKVDLRSRSKMIEFLVSHSRYNTMSSWNNMTTFSNNIKIHSIGLSDDLLNKAYSFLDCEDSYWDEIDFPIYSFTEANGSEYTIRTNGRSSGYFVLMESQLKQTEYESCCNHCGQRNFKRVFEATNSEVDNIFSEEILSSRGPLNDESFLKLSRIIKIDLSDAVKIRKFKRLKGELKDVSLSNKCGVCSNERVNYKIKPSYLEVFSSSIDHCETYDDSDEWSMERLRDRVKLITNFDHACDLIRLNYISFLTNCVVDEAVVQTTSIVKKFKRVSDIDISEDSFDD